MTMLRPGACETPAPSGTSGTLNSTAPDHSTLEVDASYLNQYIEHGENSPQRTFIETGDGAPQRDPRDEEAPEMVSLKELPIDSAESASVHVQGQVQRRRLLTIAVIAVVIIVLGAILGGVLGSRAIRKASPQEATSSTPTPPRASPTNFSNSTAMEAPVSSSHLAAISWYDESRAMWMQQVFYQKYGTGAILAATKDDTARIGHIRQLSMNMNP